MNEVLKKISLLFEEENKKVDNASSRRIADNHLAIMVGIDKVKELILAEQKADGCNICNDTSNDRYYRNQGYKYCPHCGTWLNNNPIEKPVTNGNIIRESNGKVANLLHELADCKKCPVKDGCNVNNDYSCYGRLFDYLNQPYKEGE